MGDFEGQEEFGEVFSILGSQYEDINDVAVILYELCSNLNCT